MPGPPGGRLSVVRAPAQAVIDLAAIRSNVAALARHAPTAQVMAAVRATGRTARVHVKVDTGLGRSGVPPRELPSLLAAAVAAQAEGMLEVVGIWSHPAMHFDLVRPGLAVFGLSPVPQIAGPERFGLVPAMRLESELVLTKVLPAGHGVSYGHAYVTSQETVLGVVPLGYADGVPRHASGRDGRLGAPVQVGARRLGIAGRVCMDQFVLDLGPEAVEVAGDRVVLFGAGTDGEPTAEDWAQAVGTISYEIVTRVGVGVPREYTGGPEQVP